MNDQPKHSLSSYLTGFILSLLLTGAAFRLVMSHSLARQSLLIMLTVLACLQLVVQLMFFFGVDRERRPRWNLLAMGFAVLVIVIVAGGSLWIMHNLNYRMETPAQVNQYLNSQDGL